MDSNQTQNPNPLPGAPNVVPPPESSSNNNKMLLYLIGGLVIVIVIVGAIYWYLGSQKRQQPTPIPLPRVEDDVNSLERETSALIIEDVDSDFQNVDQDLKSL